MRGPNRQVRLVPQEQTEQHLVLGEFHVALNLPDRLDVNFRVIHCFQMDFHISQSTSVGTGRLVSSR